MFWSKFFVIPLLAFSLTACVITPLYSGTQASVQVRQAKKNTRDSVALHKLLSAQLNGGQNSKYKFNFALTFSTKAQNVEANRDVTQKLLRATLTWNLKTNKKIIAKDTQIQSLSFNQSGNNRFARTIAETDAKKKLLNQLALVVGQNILAHIKLWEARNENKAL